MRLPEDDREWSRRTVLGVTAGLIGAGASGTAAGRPDNPIEGAGAPYELDDQKFHRAIETGHHSLGGVGPARRTGQHAKRNDGDRNRAISVHGDIAVVSFLHSGNADPGRRLAVLDITEFNDAETEQELADAEFTVLSIHHSVNAEANGGHGVEISADGNYVFLATAAFLPFTDGYHGGSNGGVNLNDPTATPQVTGGVTAIDISEPSSPTTVHSLTAPFTTGAVNLDYHRIDGTEYVFATKDFGFFAPDSGVFVLRFDREPGALSVVNRWSADGNTARGGVGTEHGFSYVHDVEVHNDPRSGRPTAYVADWNRGMRVLDVSAPTDIEHVGQFDMFQTNGATPFPGLVETPDGETRRVAVANHEEYDERFDQRDDRNFMNPHWDKTNPNSTGTVFLVDCEGIYPEDPTYDGSDGPTRLGELDNWTWANVDTDPEVSFEDLIFERRHLSPHSPTVSKHVIDGQERFVVNQSHFHGGVRFLEVRPGVRKGLSTSDKRIRRVPPNPYVDREDPVGWIHDSTDWELAEIGHARPSVESADGLTPRVTTAAVANGVTFALDQYAGPCATKHEAVPLTQPLPSIEGDRAYSAGPTRTESRITLELKTISRQTDSAGSVRVRDRVPDGWQVLDETVTTYPRGVRTAVEFEESIDPGESDTLEYVVKTPDDGVATGAFGPIEVSVDGEEWIEVSGTLEEITAGPSV